MRCGSTMLLAFALASCSGSGDGGSTETAGGGAGRTIGGAGGAGGATTGGAAGIRNATGGQASDRCPEQIPTTGNACGPDGLTCTYAGSPCGTLAECTAGTWNAQTTCPPMEACPAAMPTHGEPCDLGNPVAGPLKCAYELCPAGTIPGPRYEATCGGTTWAVRELECPEAIECGPCPAGTCCDGNCEPGEWIGRNHCAVGEVCMRVNNERGDYSWDCAPNHCNPAPLDCSCAGAICSQRGFPGDWQCTSAVDAVITCECVDGC